MAKKNNGCVKITINLKDMTRKEQIAFFLRLADRGILPKPTEKERAEAEAFINSTVDDQP